MLDDLLKGFDKALNLADEIKKLEQSATPELMRLKAQANTEGVNPELMKMYDDQMGKIEGGRMEMNELIEQIKNMKL